MNGFAEALAFTIKAEGGYANVSGDAGKRTYKGISEVYHPDLWKDGPPTDAQVAECYLDEYWRPAGCELLPWPLSLAVFESAVNPGITHALSATPIDHPDPLLAALVVIAKRVAYFDNRARSRAENLQFQRGWRNRCAELAAECIRTAPFRVPVMGEE